MPKALAEYTDADLIKLGRKVVEDRLKAAVADKEKRELIKKLLDAYGEGKIKI